MTGLGALNGLPHFFPLCLGLRRIPFYPLLRQPVSASLPFDLKNIRQPTKQTTPHTPTNTPQQKDKDELFVCVA
jgi:hypothetical protein